jgi:transcription antitermination factor NusG
MSYWAVAQTEPQREHIARIFLMRERYETYAPRVRFKGGKIALLFPGYLFVRVIERFYPIMFSPGVLRLLMSGETPAHLPDKVVTGIRRGEIGGFVRLPPKHPRRGQKVRIMRGFFEGQTAVHDGMTGPERARVLLEAMGQTVRLELSSRDLAIVHPKPDAPFV